MTQILKEDLWQQIESNASTVTQTEIDRSLIPEQANSGTPENLEVNQQVAEVENTVLSRPPTTARRFPQNLIGELNLILGQNRKAYSIQHGYGNPYALIVGSRMLNSIIRQIASTEGITLRRSDLGDINAFLQDHAEVAGVVRDVWFRVAPVEGGIEVDLGDDIHTRVRITAGKVEIVKEGSATLFYRTAFSLPMVMPEGIY